MEHTKINIEIGYQDTTDDGSWGGWKRVAWPGATLAP